MFKERYLNCIRQVIKLAPAGNEYLSPQRLVASAIKIISELQVILAELHRQWLCPAVVNRLGRHVCNAHAGHSRHGERGRPNRHAGAVQCHCCATSKTDHTVIF